MNQILNLTIKLPDNCVLENKLKEDLTKALKDKSIIKTIVFVGDNDKMFAEITYLSKSNEQEEINIINNVVTNHHPLAEGEKHIFKMLMPNNRFQMIIFERKNGRNIAHIYMGKKGDKKKLHIFREAGRPQRHESSPMHLQPKDGFEYNQGWQHIALCDNKDKFQAYVYIENTDVI